MDYHQEVREEGWALMELVIPFGVTPQDLRRWQRRPDLLEELADTIKGGPRSFRRVIDHRTDPMFPGHTIETPLGNYIPGVL